MMSGPSWAHLSENTADSSSLWPSCSPSAHKAVRVISAEADPLVMAADILELGEHVLIAECLPVRINVGVAARDVEQRGHLLHVLGHNQRVGLARRLEGVVAGARDPVMLQIMPLAPQRERMNRPGMAMAGEDARGADAQDVDVVALAHAEHEGLEGHIG